MSTATANRINSRNSQTKGSIRRAPPPASGASNQNTANYPRNAGTMNAGMDTGMNGNTRINQATGINQSIRSGQSLRNTNVNQATGINQSARNGQTLRNTGFNQATGINQSVRNGQSSRNTAANQSIRGAGSKIPNRSVQQPQTTIGRNNSQNNNRNQRDLYEPKTQNPTLGQSRMQQSGRLAYQKNDGNENIGEYRFFSKNMEAHNPNPNNPFGGPYASVRPTSGVASVISKAAAGPLDAESIDQMIKLWKSSDCSILDADSQRKYLQGIVDTIRDAGWSASNYYDILRTVANEASYGNQPAQIDVPSLNTTRADNMRFSQNTPGYRRGSDISLPSLLWASVANNCNNLDLIYDGLRRVYEGELHVNLTSVPDYSGYQSQTENQAAVQFAVAAGGSDSCIAQNAGWAVRLLDDIDILDFNGQSVQSFFGAFTAMTGGPTINQNKFRVDNLSFQETTQPQPRKNSKNSNAVDNRSTAQKARAARRAAKVKASLLWYLVEQYCVNLPVIVPELESQFNIAAADGVGTTSVQLLEYPEIEDSDRPSAVRGPDGRFVAYDEINGYVPARGPGSRGGPGAYGSRRTKPSRNQNATGIRRNTSRNSNSDRE